MNKITSRQRGMSVTSWILVISVGLFFLLLGIKLIPSYLEFHSIQGVMQSIKEDPKWSKATPQKIRDIFNRRIDINGVYDFDQKSLKITRDKGRTIMELNYEVRKKMAGNVEAVMTFQETVEM